jgi:uncharacterized protein (DUF952 family)
MEKAVYKIVPAEIWQAAHEKGVFTGAGIDIADGFIHLSTAAQSVTTAALYFAGRDGLMLVAADAEKLGPALVFEPSRGGELFPHLYGPLPLSAVIWAKPLPLGPDGGHVFPEFAA